MNANTLRGVLITIAPAVLLASCSLSPDARNSSETSGTTASSVIKSASAPTEVLKIGAVKADAFNDEATGDETPVDGGQIVVRFNAEPPTMNTWLQPDAYAQYISEYVHNYLLRLNPETYEWEPSLAERWIQEDVVVRQDGTKLHGSVVSGGNGSDVILRMSVGDALRIPVPQVQDVRRGASFTFFLRRDIRFHDGKPLTAADVKF